MRRSLIETLILTSGLLMTFPRTADAQYRAGVSRPTEQTGSSILGRVGGIYTGRYGDVVPITGAPSATSGMNGSGLGSINFLGAGSQYGNVPTPPLPQAFTFSPTGARIPVTISPWAVALSGIQASELGAVSGLEYATQFHRSLSNRMPTGLPTSTSPYFAPPSSNNTLNEFFGLVPATPAETEPAPSSDTSWIELLKQANESELQTKKKRAMQLFKSVTANPIDGQEELLSQAQRALQQVMVADPQESLACLLLVHISLERRQYLSAAVNLQAAVERNPEIFQNPPDLSQYFGDPQLLLNRAREMTRFGDNNPDPVNFALQGYSAWLLQDRPRLVETLNRMQEDDIESRMTPKAKAVQYALNAAVR